MRKKIYAVLLGLSIPFFALAGLETVTYINDLVVTNPLSVDPAHQGDDHLRRIKTGIKNTFPNITGAVNATQVELNIIDGATLSTAELNILDGVTVTAAQINNIARFAPFVYKTANTAKTSDTTLSSDPHLTVSVAASSTYVFELFVRVTGDAAPGGAFKYAFTLPSGATAYAKTDGRESVGTSFDSVVVDSNTVNVNIGSISGNTVLSYTGYLITTNAGTFAYQWGQLNTDTDATTVYAGSWLRLHKVN